MRKNNDKSDSTRPGHKGIQDKDRGKQARLPSEFEVQVMMAWDSWIKGLLIPFVVLMAVLLLIFGFLPDDLRPVLIGGAILLVPAVLIVQELFMSRQEKSKRAIATLLVLAAVLGFSAYPLISQVFPEEHAFHHSFEKPDETVDIPVQSEEDRWWLLEVHGSLKPGQEAYEVAYALRLEHGAQHEAVKGTIKRGWKQVRVGRRTKGKRLADHDRNIHRLTMDLSQASSLKLTKLDGELAGPLEVFLRSEPVEWSYLLRFDIPVLALAAILETLETKKRKKLHLTSYSAFMLIFGAVFTDNLAPGVLMGPLIMGLVMALAASLLFGLLLPPLLKPVLKRLGMIS